MRRVLLTTGVAFASLASAAAQVIENDSIRQYSLNEVFVNATKAAKGTPMAFTDISKDQLNKNNYGQDVPYLISQTPSVIVTSDAGTGIGYTSFRVRGTDANRINVTVNGVPVNDSESHTVFWVNMSDFASSVDNVQVQRGAGTSTNGAASFGASISMQTQKPNLKPYGEYSLTGGAFNTMKHTFSGGTGLLYNHFVFDARYSKIDSDGFIDRAFSDMSSYYGSAAYYNGGTTIKYQVFGSAETTGQAWNGVPSNVLATGNRTYNSCGEYTEIIDGIEVTKYYNNTDNYWQTHHHLTFAQEINNRWSASATLHYTDGKGYYEDYKASQKFKKYGLLPFTGIDGKIIEDSDLIRQKWLNNDFYGAIANLNYSDSKLNAMLGLSGNIYDGDHYGLVKWVKNYNNLTPDHKYYDGNGTKKELSSFLKGTYNFSETLSAYADIQYRHIDYRITGTDDKAGALDVDRKYNFVNPKAGINYFKNRHNAYASFSMANREPNRNNFTEAGPDERPTHETLFDYELGYSYSSSCWNIGSNLYWMQYKNQLVLTGEVSEIGEALTKNIDNSYRRGIELMGGVKICKAVEWNGNVSLSENKIQNFIETIYDYDTYAPTVIEHGDTDIAFSPNIIANSIFSFYFRNWSANFSSVYVGRQYLDNTSTKDRSINPYFVNNLQLAYSFKPSFAKEIALSVKINNIFDEKYETNGWVYTATSVNDGYTPENRYKEDGLFTQAGTNVMAGISIRF